MENGYIHVYTGDGKGKTTAAIGLAVRAAGAEKHVLIAQFAKGRDCCEHIALRKLSDNITCKKFGNLSFIHSPQKSDIELAQKALDEVNKEISTDKYDVVILDEANVAVKLGLITIEKLIEVINNRPRHMEIIITGRDAHEKLIEIADVVTEMKEIKHYYSKGVKARSGIEK